MIEKWLWDIYWWFIFRRVEKILGFELYDWVKQFVRNPEADYPLEGRRTGRTTAYMLRQLLTPNAGPLNVSNPYIMDVVDEQLGYTYARAYRDDLLRMKAKLNDGRLHTRDVIYVKSTQKRRIGEDPCIGRYVTDFIQCSDVLLKDTLANLNAQRSTVISVTQYGYQYTIFFRTTVAYG